MIPINPAKSSANLLSQIAQLVQNQQRFALLTLVHIEGSAPYPLGSQMLVSRAGQAWGQITGGCAETALIEQALNVLEEGGNKVERYGLNSPYFDIQLPCGSGIDVLFDVETPVQKYQQVIDTVGQRCASTLELYVGEIHFKKYYLPTERLIVFGQGPILTHLLTLASESGFETVAIVQEEHDLHAVKQLGFQAKLFREVDRSYESLLDAHSAVVSLFHEHEREQPILKTVLEHDVFFVGALGSQRTQTQRLEALALQGVSAAKLKRVQGPVGMNIAAESPAQIAVSILAEVIQAMPKQRLLYA